MWGQIHVDECSKILECDRTMKAFSFVERNNNNNNSNNSNNDNDIDNDGDDDDDDDNNLVIINDNEW